MAKRQSAGNPRLNAVAEMAGRSLGRMARAVKSLKARHPDPVSEVRDALRAGRRRVIDLSTRAQARSTSIVKDTKAAAKQARSAAARIRRKTTKAVSAASRRSSTAVKQVKRALRTSRAKLSAPAKRRR